jgi:hypothetical protein
VSRPLLLLIGGALAFWLLAGLPALVFSGAAVLLCLPPMAATLLWAGWVRDKAPADQMIMIAGSTGVRMAFVLGGGLALFLAVPYFQGQVAFWVWVLVVYLFTLALDVALMLAMRPSENLPSPRSTGERGRG